MKLANLAYEIVRDAIEFPSGFNKEGFIRGEYDSDRDFSSQISFAFNYINAAFNKLTTAKKTKLKSATKTSDSIGYIGFTDGEITSVVSKATPDYKLVRYKTCGDGIAIERTYIQKPIIIEYRPTIPHFALEDIRSQEMDDDDELYYEEVEIELNDYGITDEMCAYVKEYAKGGLLEYLSPELSQKHIMMAESYLSNLKTRYTEYPQREVEDAFRGGGAW